MMILSEIVFNLANFLFFIGSLPLIYGVIKNRDGLRGYNFYGTFLTLSALITIDIAYVMMGYWTSLALSLTTDAYWIFAFAFVIKEKLLYRRFFNEMYNKVIGVKK
jgi:hypothetical protein